MEMMEMTVTLSIEVFLYFFDFSFQCWRQGCDLFRRLNFAMRCDDFFSIIGYLPFHLINLMKKVV